MESEERNKWKQLMRAIEFFKPLDDEEMDELLNHCQVRKYGYNELVVKESNAGNIFYVVMHGNVKIIKGEPLKANRTLAIISKGDCFGEMALLLDEPRTATAIAGQDCILFEINGKIEKLRPETQVKIFRQFAINLSRRLKRTNTK